MSRDSAARASSRKNEIVLSCAKLYETQGYNDITIKKIAEFTSFTRPSIYNYFRTKEEIFLAFLQREYQCWVDDLIELSATEGSVTKQMLACGIASSLEKRGNMLKLLSMNLREIEANSRIENLIEFKVVYGNAIVAMKKCLKRYCPQMDNNDVDEFVFSFFPFLFGIDPYTHRTPKQIEAMDAAGTEYTQRSIYEVVYTCVKRLI